MDTEVTKPVERFFTAFGQGDLDSLLETLHDDIVIDIAGPDSVPLYRTYHGKGEARQFIESLGGTFQTQQFNIQTLIGQDDTVMAAGVFKHMVIPTGKIFASPWALHCEIKDDKIVHYRFYEDTAAAVAAFQTN
ncbi:MAG: nuclear transport factor 2 family protein [Anaerolineae bacterium]|nr:nuclear transport factor 2 family protein [Anaerolineae bacterium]